MNTNAQLDALLELEDGLSEWEVGFVEDMANRRKADPNWVDRLTQKQIDCIERIYEKRC